MNISISHDSEVEAFVFPFPFLEDSPALGSIDGSGKQKRLCFDHTKLKRLLTLEQENKELDEEEEEKMEKRGEVCFGQEEKRGLCCVKMRKNGGLYIGKGRGVRFGHLGWVWVGK